MVEVQRFRLRHLPAAVGQQLARECSRALAGFHDLLDRAVVRVRRGKGIQQDMAITVNDGQQVIKVVRNPAGQHADRFHLGRLPYLFFQLLTFRDVLEHG
jgi:hypothetical protein